MYKMLIKRRILLSVECVSTRSYCEVTKWIGEIRDMFLSKKPCFIYNSRGLFKKEQETML